MFKVLFLAYGALTALSWALPPYAALFKAKYKYRPACSLCHDADSWQLNEYGKLFLKHERNFAALKALEGMDPDKDGVVSLREIEAKSSPSDSRSTPKNPGAWLQNALPPFPPRKHLEVLFPGQSEYTLYEKELEPKQIKTFQSAFGSELRDEERFPVYFAAGKKDKSAGLALYLSTADIEPCFMLAGYAQEGADDFRVAGLRMLHCHKKPLSEENYLAQFMGKSTGELDFVRAPRKDLEPQSKAIVKSVRRGALILKLVAGKEGVR